MAQWITRLTTDQKIAGSNPARIDNIFVLEQVAHPGFPYNSNLGSNLAGIDEFVVVPGLPPFNHILSARWERIGEPLKMVLGAYLFPEG